MKLLKKLKDLPTILGIILFYLALIMFVVFVYVSPASATPEELTYCINYEGVVVVVTDYHCPDNFWPL
jgi:acyl-CoA synthetase (AMP-forming)/AMP-acid ligase II